MAETEAPAVAPCEPSCSCQCNQILRTCACKFPEPVLPPPAEPSNFSCLRCGVSTLPDGVRAINKDGRTIDLCYVHEPVHRPALEKRGWTIVRTRILAEVQA